MHKNNFNQKTILNINEPAQKRGRYSNIVLLKRLQLQHDGKVLSEKTKLKIHELINSSWQILSDTRLKSVISQIKNSALRNLPKNVQQTVKSVLKLLLTTSALAAWHVNTSILTIIYKNHTSSNNKHEKEQKNNKVNIIKLFKTLTNSFAPIIPLVLFKIVIKLQDKRNSKKDEEVVT
jgi:hypothetical protein